MTRSRLTRRIPNRATLHASLFTAPAWPLLAQFSGLREELPENVHILTLEALSSSRLLLRLEHLLLEKEDKEANDKPIPITRLLKGNHLEDVREATLTGHMLLDEMRRLRWRQTQTSAANTVLGGSGLVRDQEGYKVRLADGRIRTYYATLVPKAR
ncbi:hypothetical protein V5799_002882 [Amblyomma americanum]|uniref:Uncharacterized protein n=1 Tax=Amblyomma americanum TaxID=6943 RepID=A0AAQ4DAJ6_AMBAM